MRVQESDLAFTSRASKVLGGEGRRRSLVRVAQGCYLAEDVFGARVQPWEARRMVAEARIWAARRQMSRRGEPVFTGDSALIIRGCPTWWDNPDVSVRRARRSSTPILLKRVQQESILVPEVRVRQVAAMPSYGKLKSDRMNGLHVAPPGLTLVDLCRRSHVLQAFFGAASLIASMASFDRSTFEDSQVRVNQERLRLCDELTQYGGVQGVRRARALVERVPVGFDSPPEVVVSWVLMTMLPSGSRIVSQLPVPTPLRMLFIDVALPDYGIAVEISGVGKFGEGEEIRTRIDRFLERQQQLLDAGWLSVNVKASETLDLLELARTLYRRLRPHGVPVGEPRGILWEAQTEELFHRDRRY